MFGALYKNNKNKHLCKKCYATVNKYQYGIYIYILTANGGLKINHVYSHVLYIHAYLKTCQKRPMLLYVN